MGLFHWTAVSTGRSMRSYAADRRYYSRQRENRAYNERNWQEREARKAGTYVGPVSRSDQRFIVKHVGGVVVPDGTADAYTQFMLMYNSMLILWQAAYDAKRRDLAGRLALAQRTIAKEFPWLMDVHGNLSPRVARDQKLPAIMVTEMRNLLTAVLATGGCEAVQSYAGGQDRTIIRVIGAVDPVETTEAATVSPTMSAAAAHIQACADARIAARAGR